MDDTINNCNFHDCRGASHKYCIIPDTTGVERGIYTLVLYLDRPCRIHVGSLGEFLFDRGYYSYTGSARGRSGFRRIDRHLRIIRGESCTRRWHIDYLLPLAHLVEVVRTPTNLDIECEIAIAIGLESPVPRFGSSDCSCISHLHHTCDLDQILHAVHEAHGNINSHLTDR